jgi:hypothetical protein
MSDMLGYAAAAAVLTSFLMRSMVPLRLIAILSNVLFISYGYLAAIQPVLLLHTVLLPINIARLAALLRGDVSIRRHYDRYRVPATARLRHISLFLLGLTAGSLGIRAVIHLAYAFFSQCRRNCA